MKPKMQKNHLSGGLTATLAKTSTLRLSRFLEQQTEPTVSILLNDGGEPLVVTVELLQQFLALLNETAKGNEVVIRSVGDELTTAQAAELLNMSRPYVVELIEKGELPATKTGTHRRLKMADVLKFDEERRQKRELALQELAALSQEMGLYD